MTSNPGPAMSAPERTDAATFWAERAAEIAGAGHEDGAVVPFALVSIALSLASHAVEDPSPGSDIQTEELLDALDRRNVQSAGDLEMYDRQSLDLERLRAGVHAWFCTGSARMHAGTDKRPHIGWPCERGTKRIADVYAAFPSGPSR